MPEATSPNIKSDPLHPAALLRRYGLRARKRLGQNFLVSLDLARRIVALAELPPDSTVVELGVGLGLLTSALAERAQRVIGYEIDTNLLQVLKKEGLSPKVELRRGDILSLDYRALAQELGGRLLLFGNLPYYLSSRLLYKLFEEREAVLWAVFMFQKEVAARLLAQPGSKDYGPLCILLSLRGKIRKLLDLSPNHFYPRPEVYSSVVKIEFDPTPLPHEERFKWLLKVAFANRRKKLLRNLLSTGLEKGLIEAAFKATGLSLNTRAEEVTPPQFLELLLRLYAPGEVVAKRSLAGKI